MKRDIYPVYILRKSKYAGGESSPIDPNLEIIKGIYSRPYMYFAPLYHQDGSTLGGTAYYYITLSISDPVRAGSVIYPYRLHIPVTVANTLRNEPVRIPRQTNSHIEYNLTEYVYSAIGVIDIVNTSWVSSSNTFTKYQKTGRQEQYEYISGISMEQLSRLSLGAIQTMDKNDVITTKSVENDTFVEISAGSNFPSVSNAITIIS